MVVSITDPMLILFFSMGGSIAVHVAIQKLLSSLIGLVVIDVVEGQWVCII